MQLLHQPVGIDWEGGHVHLVLQGPSIKAGPPWKFEYFDRKIVCGGSQFITLTKQLGIWTTPPIIFTIILYNYMNLYYWSEFSVKALYIIFIIDKSNSFVPAIIWVVRLLNDWTNQFTRKIQVQEWIFLCGQHMITLTLLIISKNYQQRKMLQIDKSKSYDNW